MHVQHSYFIKIVLFFPLIVLKNIQFSEEPSDHFESMLRCIQAVLFRIEHLLIVFKLLFNLMNLICNDLSTFAFLLGNGRV